MARPFRFNLVSVALELRQESGATRGLTQFSVDEIGSRVGNPRTFVWAVQIILAGLDESVVFDHDEMLVWNERGVSRAVFCDDAAAIGQSDEHAVPFEVALIRVMDVEKDFGIGEERVALRGGQIAARRFRFGESERDETQMAIAL